MAHNELSFQHHADVGFESKSDWQPISKAPRDGSTLVLAWHKDWPNPKIVRWDMRDDPKPTHWYPVPPLPGK